MSLEIEINPTQIELPPQVRQENSKANDEGALLRLGESMKVEQIAAVGVVKHYTMKDWYRAVWGFRRIRAAVLVKRPTIRARVLESGLNESQYKLLQATENFLRADLTPFEKWNACLELLNLNPGWGGKDLADHLHLDPGTITRLLSPSKCTTAIQEALKGGQIGISDCYAMSRVAEKDQGGLLAAKLNRSTRNEPEWKGRKVTNGLHEPKLSRAKIPYPGGEVAVTGKELSVATVKAILETMTKVLRKAEGVFDLDTVIAMENDKLRSAAQ